MIDLFVDSSPDQLLPWANSKSGCNIKSTTYNLYINIQSFTVNQKAKILDHANNGYQTLVFKYLIRFPRLLQI